MNSSSVAKPRLASGAWTRLSAVVLASHASDFITGETIRVDDGYAIP